MEFEDYNECANDPCHDDAYRTISYYLYEFDCFTGFKGSSDGTCDDINECKVITYNCDNNSNCINKLGDFNCECKMDSLVTDLSAMNSNKCEPAEESAMYFVIQVLF